MYKEILVKLYPYLGCSNNLIEFFAIIGYEEKLLNENSNLNVLENKSLKLSVISTIISESFKNNVNFEDIIKKVYPDKPSIIQIKKSDIVKPKSTNVILSSCIDSLNGEKKICYSCYALRFYEKYKHKDKMEYYVPKAFLLYSQYPFFNTFYNICYKLHIYNEFYMEDSLPLEILIHCLVNYIPNPIKNNIIIKDFKPNITIPKLSGYPYLDFNLCEIFNTIPIKEFIKVYILAFLEVDTLFFSPNLEKLNLFMYMLYILNYPLTDSNYFWHIKSISKNDINSLSEMIGSIFLGVNAEFNIKNIELEDLTNVSFIVNLENKKNIINNISHSKESEELNSLTQYIHNILNHKETKSFFLLDSLLSLKHKLKVIKQIYDKKAKKELNSFFYVDKYVIEINRLIQEAFYDFILTFLIFVKNDYLYDYSTFSIIKNTNIQSNSQFTEAENIFLKYFRYTIKYTTYFGNFISYFNTFDELKISLLITDEFVDLKEKNISKILKDDKSVSYFNIMDNLYEAKAVEYKVNFNNINKEFKIDKENNVIDDIKKIKKNQLFVLDKDVINDFLNYQNNKLLIKLFQIEINDEFSLKSIKMANISKIIQNHFTECLDKSYYMYSSIVYLFSIIFPLFTFNNNIYFLSILLYRLQKMKYFQRFYVNVLLKSINKYYSSNQEIFHFSELNFENIKNYCDLIRGHLIKNKILPNEEIFKFYQNLSKEEKNFQKSDSKVENINDNIFNYEYEKEENYINNYKEDIITKDINMLIYNYKGDKVRAIFLSYKLIFQQISLYYEDYFVRFNFNMDTINVKGMVEILINLIYYISQYKDLETCCILLNCIIILKQLDDQIKSYRQKIKKNNINNNNEDKNKNNTIDKIGNNINNVNNSNDNININYSEKDGNIQ